ncbi:hypothetical protein A1354_00865 [Pseudomonas asplenii]|nr:hypothetical protein [Pseudomonas asplenii]PNG45433.1 hypothetical protein A1354_00865 [Pseudomonas asplenii]
MEAKDQRLEIRLSQQQLDELDSIRQSADSPFVNSRSDVVRMFISQGLERFSGHQEQSVDILPLGQRLSLFFQLEQVGNGIVIAPPHQNPYSYHPNKEKEISGSELVKRIYLDRYFWFFELDVSSLEKINTSLKADAFVALMNKEPNDATKRNLAHVVAVIGMFDAIEKCLESAREQDISVEFLENSAHRYGVPLSFSGFPEEMLQLNQMSALIRWLSNKATWLYLSPSKQNDSAIYQKMLSVYDVATRNHSGLNLDMLQEMIFDCRQS